jgi:hypothetical protein
MNADCELQYGSWIYLSAVLNLYTRKNWVPQEEGPRHRCSGYRNGFQILIIEFLKVKPLLKYISCHYFLGGSRNSKTVALMSVVNSDGCSLSPSSPYSIRPPTALFFRHVTPSPPAQLANGCCTSSTRQSYFALCHWSDSVTA